MKWKPALAAVAVALLLIVGWLGYQRHLRGQAELARQQRIQEQDARDQAIVALRITSVKLNRVFQRVARQQTNGPTEPKIRREQL